VIDLFVVGQKNVRLLFFLQGSQNVTNVGLAKRLLLTTTYTQLQLLALLYTCYMHGLHWAYKPVIYINIF